MKSTLLGILATTLLAIWSIGCTAGGTNTGDDPGSDVDSDTDTDTDTDNDTDTDSDGDTDTDEDTDSEYDGPTIPETCAQAAQATTSVGCLFYAVDLDSHDIDEDQQYAVAVSNVNQTDTATVTVHKGNGVGWDLHDTTSVGPMSLHTFELPAYNMNSSGLMPKGSYRIESDVPIIVYQFNPVDGAVSYLSDASMLIPVTSLSLTYDIVGWKQNCCDGDMRAYFTVVATQDDTVVTVTTSVVPLPGGVVPASTAPFDVEMDDGDVLEVQTDAIGESLTGSRVVSNTGHPIVVFSGQECANIPEMICCCDHLEEQLPGLRFWGTEIVAARMPVRSTVATAEQVLWQIYASEDNTTVTLSASPGVTGLPASPLVLDQGEMIEFYAGGTQSSPGDFLIQANKPIGVMQYMTGTQNLTWPDDIGDPAMVYVVPAEQFLPRYVVLVPSTWINDTLVVTRLIGSTVLLDGIPIPDSEFVPVAGSNYEVARHDTADGIHTIESDNGADGIGVIVVGYDDYDSYAYSGGMGLAAINPVIE